MPEKRSDEWPKRWKQAYAKWRAIVKKTKNEEIFDRSRGFENLTVWDSCGYCDEYHSKSIVICSSCPLNQRKILWKNQYIPVCHNHQATKSAVRLYVKEMFSFNPSRKKAIKLATIVRDEIAKDSPK